MRHLHLRVIGIGLSQPRRDLFRRPPGSELPFHGRAQALTLGELRPLGRRARLRAARSGLDRPVFPPAVGVHLTADGRGTTALISRQWPGRETGGRDQGDLFTFLRVRDAVPTAHGESVAFLPWSAMNTLSETFCRPSCLAMRLTGTPASRRCQNRLLVSSESRFHSDTSWSTTSLFANQVGCCVDRLSHSTSEAGAYSSIRAAAKMVACQAPMIRFGR